MIDWSRRAGDEGGNGGEGKAREKSPRWLWYKMPIEHTKMAISIQRDRSLYGCARSSFGASYRGIINNYGQMRFVIASEIPGIHYPRSSSSFQFFHDHQVRSSLSVVASRLKLQQQHAIKRTYLLFHLSFALSPFSPESGHRKNLHTCQKLDNKIHSKFVCLSGVLLNFVGGLHPIDR